MYKNIVFDLGNVLVMYYPEKVLRKYLDDDDDVSLLMREFYGRGVINDTDRGVKTYEEIIEECRPYIPDRLVALLKRLYVESCYGCNEMPPFPEMYSLVKKLKENGYHVYLLSNAGRDFYVYSKKFPVLDLMDGTVISSDYKQLKPEPEIYKTLFEKYSLTPSECIFIDDMQRNIDGALKCGMDGICFSPSFEDVTVLIEKLRSKNIKI
ncbi:MAG: HAD family phosphatase [Clostridiales bacterium]|nr:HAD family phosphatase [Clostridiales bacterium]